MCAGLLRAVGDSKAALYFLIFSAIINTVLDIYFIAYLHMGVRSAGVATIISQGISAVLCFNYIRILYIEVYHTQGNTYGKISFFPNIVVDFHSSLSFF